MHTSAMCMIGPVLSGGRRRGRLLRALMCFIKYSQLLQAFYLGIRETLLHEILAAMSEDDWPADLAYSDQPSTKINALLALIRHHLLAPGLPPLAVVDSANNTLGPDPDYLPQADGSPPAKTVVQEASLGPDRIVVYLAFPKNNWIVKKVSLICIMSLTCYSFSRRLSTRPGSCLRRLTARRARRLGPSHSIASKPIPTAVSSSCLVSVW